MGAPITAAGFGKFCRLLTIDDQGDRGRISFELNDEQKVVAAAMALHPWLYVVKPRQVGLSTAILAKNIAWAIQRDILQKPAECALIWDELDKVRAKIYAMHRMLEGIGAPHQWLAKGEIWFPNGTCIKGYTAGGANPGRGGTLKRVHASEPPFWRRDPKRVWSGIVNSLVGSDTESIIETTMDPTVPFAQEMWDAQNRFHKLFLSTSLHVAYRRYDLVAGLRDDQKEMLRAEGFVTPDGVQTPDLLAAGAWWLEKLAELQSLTWLKRDFPQIVEHCFAQDFGRWVRTDPVVLDPLEVVRVDGISDRDMWEAEIFVHPEDIEGECIISVDTSEGVGQDRSAIIVLDAATDRVAASFASEHCMYDDLARVTASLADRFRIGAGAGKRAKHDREPTIVVEKNGIGSSTVRELVKIGWSVTPFLSKAETKYRGLRHAKREIEQGRAYGPQCLREDARTCNKDGTRWHGKKDVLTALGFAHCYLEDEKEPVAEEQTSEMWAQYQKHLGLEQGGELF